MDENKKIKYSELDWMERKSLREEYIKIQNGRCMYCNEDLAKSPPSIVTDKKINWSKFPPEFLKYPVHLQHSHKTGFVEGATHSYCNAVMWQYEGR